MSRVVTPATSQPTATPHLMVPHDKIAMRAYERWIKKGKPQGTHVQDWLEAEAELKAEVGRGALGTGSAPLRR